MHGTTQSVLGIDLANDEIRVVELSIDNGVAQPQCAGSKSIPAGALVDGVVVQPHAVAGALRLLLTEIGAISRVAVLGVPPAGCMVRTLNLPPTDPENLESLVEGEIQHFQILHTEGAAHGFFPLKTARFDFGVDPTVALLIGCERPVIHGLAEVARLAGVKIARIEPTHIAMIRTAYDDIGSRGSVMSLIVSNERCDIALVDEGNFCFYRRIELGIDHFTTVDAELHDGAEFPHALQTQQSGSLAYSHYADAAPSSRSVAQLCTELRRSMEYFARENRASEPVERLVVVANGMGLASIAPQIGRTLGLHASVVSCPTPVGEGTQTILELAGPSSTRYTAAFGLALGELEREARTPKMDLFAVERAAVVDVLNRKRTTVALLASIGAIGIGVVASYFVGMRANHVDHELDHVKEDVTFITDREQAMTSLIDSQRQQTEALSAHDVRFNRVVDSVLDSLAPGVGMSELRLYPNGTVDIVGESLEEGTSIETARRLQNQSLFEHVMLASFEQAQPGTKVPGVRFKLVCTERSSVAAGQTPTGGGQ